MLFPMVFPCCHFESQEDPGDKAGQPCTLSPCIGISDEIDNAIPNIPNAISNANSYSYQQSLFLKQNLRDDLTCKIFQKSSFSNKILFGKPSCDN